MKSYILSVVITSILIALSELVLPQGKMKIVVGTIFSIVLLFSILSPLVSVGFDDSMFVFNSESEVENLSNEKIEEYFDLKIENYYQKEYERSLMDNDLVVEQIKVEVSRKELVKVEIFLSNLVIPEDNSHINNYVITNYVAKILGVDSSLVTIYA